MKCLAWIAALGLVTVGLAAPASAQRYVERARFRQPMSTFGASFGASVATDGTTAVIGAPEAASGAGEIYVFDVAGTAPVLLGRVSSLELRALGASVAVQGSLIVAGAPLSTVEGVSDVGQVVVLRRSATTITTVRRFGPPAAGFDGGAFFGRAVAISGLDAVVVGAPGTRTAYWFDAVSVAPLALYSRPAPLVPGYGGSLAVTAVPARTAVAVAIGTGDPSVVADVDVWVVTAAGATLGGTIPNTEGEAGFGNAIALDGTMAAIGTPPSDTVRLYGYDPSAGAGSLIDTWEGPSGSRFGGSLAMHGSLVFAGAPDDASVFGDRGTAYVLRGDTITHYRPAIRTSTGMMVQGLGASIAFAGGKLVSGAPASGGEAFLFEDRTVPTCTTNTDCLAGELCTDGVCCADACGGDPVDCQACATDGALGWCAIVEVGTSCETADRLCSGACTGESPLCDGTLACMEGDAGVPEDGGEEIDAGAVDASHEPLDAATPPPGVRFGGGGGCRCAAAGTGGSGRAGGLVLALLALAIVRRRRGRRSRSAAIHCSLRREEGR